MPPRLVVFLSALCCVVFSGLLFHHLHSVEARGNAFASAPKSQPSRVVRVAPASGPVGGTVSIPIELVSLGNENAIGFSLTFNPAVLSDPQTVLGSDAAGASYNTNSAQAAQGRLGVALAFQANQTFAAGTRQVVVVTFSIAANASFGTAPIGFGDQPIFRELSDVNASSLTADFPAGAVTITKGFEADLTPRPDGDNNGTVTITDWVQLGRFVAGLDSVEPGNEFQRADCAPRDALGDGRITIIDWTQAGRYAAGLDPVVAAGGPTAPSDQALIGPPRTADRSMLFPARQSPRSILGARQIADEGQLEIELTAQGTENALGFSLNFNPAEWQFATASLGNDAREASLQINSKRSKQGQIGFALAFPAGRAMPAGARQLLRCSFARVFGAKPASFALSFGDAPIQREIADANAKPVLANYESPGMEIGSLANVSAASFNGGELAPEQIVSAFGTRLAARAENAVGTPPLSLGGTVVRITDSSGLKHTAPLFFVSPTQVNYLLPASVAEGLATVTITGSDGGNSNGTIHIAAAAPGLFTANADGRGLAAAVGMRIGSDGAERYEPIAQYDVAQRRFIARPLELGTESDPAYLILFGTGLRRVSNLARIRAEIDGQEMPLLYAGPQGEMMGLDQINLALPPGLRGRGEVEIRLIVDGKPTNAVGLWVR